MLHAMLCVLCIFKLYQRQYWMFELFINTVKPAKKATSNDRPPVLTGHFLYAKGEDRLHCIQWQNTHCFQNTSRTSDVKTREFTVKCYFCATLL